MKIRALAYDLTVCKVEDLMDLHTSSEIFFIGRTDEELSLVCETSSVPEKTIAREDGWKAMRIEGILDFSLMGILSRITTILADNKIGIFAVSTYNTDYILVKEASFEKALSCLEASGYEILR